MGPQGHRRGKWLLWISAALAIASAGSLVEPVPAAGGANSCGTALPSGPADSSDALGQQWFDPQNGLWEEAPPSSNLGYAGVDPNGIQVNVEPENNSGEVNVGPSAPNGVCAQFGATGDALNTGEFPKTGTPAIVPLPWLTQDGAFFKNSLGQTILLRGVNYSYNQEIFEPEYNLTDADFARIHSWGINLIRIGLSGYRSGYDYCPFPSLAVSPGCWPGGEPGYLDHLDQLIADANRHGIYALVMLAGANAEAFDWQWQVEDDKEKFIPGTPQWDWWMKFELSIFNRYKNWPGVIGFDTMNEEDAYPPPVMDNVFVGPAHQALDRQLRQVAQDSRHVYFQEPSGWSYFGTGFWEPLPQQHQGVALNGLSDPEGNLGDANRYYCPKYEPSSTAIYASDLAYYKELAVQAGAPLFICELWVAQSGTNDQIVSEQEAVDNALDQAMVGGVQIQYPFGSGYSMLNPDGSEVFWIPEFARPYPEWVGGTLSSVQEDFASSTLTVGLKLDSSGPTDIYTSETRNYPSGFVATDSAGDYLTFDGNNVLSASGMFWDGYDQYVVLLPKTGPLTFTLKPLTPSALAALARRAAAVRYHPACHGCQ